MKSLSAISLLALLITACSSPSSDTYKSEEVGKVITTSEGTVLSSRTVEIEGESTVAGPLVGAGAGAATGLGTSAALGSTSGLATVVGALAGAGIGYLVEGAMNDREGTEYIIRLDDGRVVTLVDNKEEGKPPIEDGTPVLVQYGGSYTRVVAKPQNLDASGGSDAWVNPDSLPPGVTPPGAEVDSDTLPPEEAEPAAAGPADAGTGAPAASGAPAY